jgi:hypothetical protein
MLQAELGETAASATEKVKARAEDAKPLAEPGEIGRGRKWKPTQLERPLSFSCPRGYDAPIATCLLNSHPSKGNPL